MRVRDLGSYSALSVDQQKLQSDYRFLKSIWSGKLHAADQVLTSYLVNQRMFADLTGVITSP
jgi:hypothetical protein